MIQFLRLLALAIGGLMPGEAERRAREAQWRINEQMNRRAYLERQIRKARRQHRRVKETYSEARALTHGILARGGR